MGVGTWVVPDHQAQDGSTYKLNIKNAFLAAQRLAAAFAPHEQAAPNMTVRLDAGAIFAGGTLTEVAAQSTGTITAPTGNPRIDRIVIDHLSGAVSVVTGTEAASPSPPAIPAGKFPVAKVYLTVGKSTITNQDITDERMAVGSGGGAGEIGRVVKTGAYTVVAGDKGEEIACTGTFPLSFSACASLGANFYCWIKLLGAGKLTLQANGSEKFFFPGGDPAGVNSLSISTFDPTAILYGVDSLLVQTDGTDLHVLAASQVPARARPIPAPSLIRSSQSVVKVAASADAPAGVAMVGFPNPLNPGAFISGGLTDGRYRLITADAPLDMTQASARWGDYKDMQWYMVYALAANAATDFILKAMPLMRVSGQDSHVVTLRNNANTNDIGYGFGTNELANGKILILTGSAAGQVRSITANNNDNGSAGTITYSGAVLAISSPDWFVVLPPGTNFRWIRNFFHQTTGGNPDITDFFQLGDWVNWKGGKAWDYRYIDPMSALQQTDLGIILNQSNYYGGSVTLIYGYAYPAGYRG